MTEAIKQIQKFNKVIIVGLDGVGKTTIAKDLEADGYKYIKASVSDGDDKLSLAVQLLEESDKYDKVVFDRFYLPDNLVYSKFIAGSETSSTDINDWVSIANMIKDRDITFIYVTDDINDIIKRMDSRGDEYITSSQLADIALVYNDVINKLCKLTTVMHLDLKLNTLSIRG